MDGSWGHGHGWGGVNGCWGSSNSWGTNDTSTIAKDTSAMPGLKYSIFKNIIIFPLIGRLFFKTQITS